MRLVYIVDVRTLDIPRFRIPKLVARILLATVINLPYLDYQTAEGHSRDVGWSL